MSGKAKQLEILRDIIAENFEAKENGVRQQSVLYEVTEIEETTIPEGLTILVNFDDKAKVRMMAMTPFYGGGYTEEEDDERFIGNLNIFVMKKKKTLKHIHVSYNGKEFANKKNSCSLREILSSFKAG